MEKMINVINNNLRNVINGIKEHKLQVEHALTNIKKEMDVRISESATYKTNVIDARNIISSLEQEISILEFDLKDLTSKYDSEDFKEILIAGNKGINAKILEKKALITEQSNRIADLTAKAHEIKDDLVDLRERKKMAEEDLRKTKILEKFYENKINDIIDYSASHSRVLEQFIDGILEEEIEMPAENIDNVDISNIVDGAIFDEIDKISSSEPDEELLQEVLENENDLLDEEDTEDEEKIAENDLSMTRELDDVILEANQILEKNANLIKETQERLNTGVIEITDAKEEKEQESIDLSTEVEEMSDEIIGDSIFDEELEESELFNNTEEEIIDEQPIVEEEIIENEKTNELLENVHNSITIPFEEKEIEPIGFEETTEESKEEKTENEIDWSIKPTIPFGVTLPDAPEIDPTEVSNIEESLKEIGLEVSSFKESDLEKIENGFALDKVKAIVDVLKGHLVPINNLYSSANILDMDAYELDKILNILESTGASVNAIQYVFGSLDKINIDRLEISATKDSELTETLYDAMPYEGKIDLASILGLTNKEVNMLEANADKKDFEIMNMFPDIVLANYNELKKYNVDNLNECIIKHPHRFTFNPDNFSAILDKYDTADLVRCVNKNSAVIDKL